MNTVEVAFGPVPSRRLGRSLGINNIPPKICTYSCVYCQLGRTFRMQVDRDAFYDPEEIIRAVEARLSELRRKDEPVDYLTFVPDGEPTLDLNLGQEIELLKQLSIPVAVITNSSLIFREAVREELSQADWVSLKVDAASEPVWRRINRPHKELDLAEIKQGLLEFARTFRGTLASETMLIQGLNEDTAELEKTAKLLAELEPAIAYIAIPMRPPAEAWVKPADEGAVARAYALFSERLPRVELLIGYEGNAFSTIGDAVQDLLSITAVHPMRKQAVQELLARDRAAWEVVRRLLAEGKLVELTYRGERFYLRKLSGRSAG
ncbi:putative Fe-S oxidoreductase [Candidatus Bipolaricaulis anaerobius]|uniref:Putative Fe-S oxidoreductase n=1 Tax=Candidatus Bipolaricaulis anaerobius TaxID=2026885 RepID=A0A2X3ML13_9BACT|nr:putative Fe-S oxidoreductase [Candidatus Bipolaricaulis anaerobius]